MVAVVNCTSVTVAVHIGFGHEPGAETLIVNVVSPRPATLPVHCTCVPMSVQVGVPTKCPACASAAPAKVVTSVSAATTATTRPRTERLVRMFPPPYLVVLAGWAAVTGPLGEPLLSVAGAAAIKDHSGQVAAQVVAWPPLANADYGVGRSLKTRDSLVRPGEGVKTCREKTSEIAAYRYQSRRGQCD